MDFKDKYLKYKKKYLKLKNQIGGVDLSDDQINKKIGALRKKYETLVEQARQEGQSAESEYIKQLGNIFTYRRQWLHLQKKVPPPNFVFKPPPENWGVHDEGADKGLVFHIYSDDRMVTFNDDFMEDKF
jgi:hypothetical protein